MDEVSCDNCDYFPILKNEHDSKGKVHFHSPFTFSGPLDIDSQTRVTLGLRFRVRPINFVA